MSSRISPAKTFCRSHSTRARSSSSKEMRLALGEVSRAGFAGGHKLEKLESWDPGGRGREHHHRDVVSCVVCGQSTSGMATSCAGPIGRVPP